MGDTFFLFCLKILHFYNHHFILFLLLHYSYQFVSCTRRTEPAQPRHESYLPERPWPSQWCRGCAPSWRGTVKAWKGETASNRKLVSISLHRFYSRNVMGRRYVCWWRRGEFDWRFWGFSSDLSFSLAEITFWMVSFFSITSWAWFNLFLFSAFTFSITSLKIQISSRDILGSYKWRHHHPQ